MEFEILKEFFASLTHVKRKYPMIITYNKYLNSIKDTTLMEREIDLFRAFLVHNPEERVLSNPEFKTGKPALVLNMTNFLMGGDDVVNDFWTRLSYLEGLLFPRGRPTQEEFDAARKSAGAGGLTGAGLAALSILEKNPMFADVVSQVKSSVSGMTDVSDVSEILDKPEFKSMVDNIKNGLTTGKYKLKDLTSTVGAIINSVQDDLDPETRSTLTTVTDTMTAVERGEAPDMAKIMNAVTNLKINQK